MEQDMDAPHMALLVNSMYRDEYKDDAYQRLQYLQLWQSLVETGEKYLGYWGRASGTTTKLWPAKRPSGS